MSYTALYGPLRPLDRTGKGIRIRDREALETWASVFDAENILRDAEITEELDYGSYPRTSWDVLYGFRTWNPSEPVDDHDRSTLGAYHNIERLGYFYGGNFTSFWAGLSLATEPFEVYQPAPEHGLDEAGEDIIRTSTEPGDDYRRTLPESPEGVSVAHVRARDGEATVDILSLGVLDVLEAEDTSTVTFDG